MLKIIEQVEEQRSYRLDKKSINNISKRGSASVALASSVFCNFRRVRRETDRRFIDHIVFLRDGIDPVCLDRQLQKPEGFNYSQVETNRKVIGTVDRVKVDTLTRVS